MNFKVQHWKRPGFQVSLEPPGALAQTPTLRRQLCIAPNSGIAMDRACGDRSRIRWVRAHPLDGLPSSRLIALASARPDSARPSRLMAGALCASCGCIFVRLYIFWFAWSGTLSGTLWEPCARRAAPLAESETAGDRPPKRGRRTTRIDSERLEGGTEGGRLGDRPDSDPGRDPNIAGPSGPAWAIRPGPARGVGARRNPLRRRP